MTLVLIVLGIAILLGGGACLALVLYEAAKAALPNHLRRRL